jgi:hypothetical protein
MVSKLETTSARGKGWVLIKAKTRDTVNGEIDVARRAFSIR